MPRSVARIPDLEAVGFNVESGGGSAIRAAVGGGSDAPQGTGPHDGLGFGTVALQAAAALDAGHLWDGDAQVLTQHRDQDAGAAGPAVDADREQRHLMLEVSGAPLEFSIAQVKRK